MRSFALIVVALATGAGVADAAATRSQAIAEDFALSIAADPGKAASFIDRDAYFALGFYTGNTSPGDFMKIAARCGKPSIKPTVMDPRASAIQGGQWFQITWKACPRDRAGHRRGLVVDVNVTDRIMMGSGGFVIYG